VTFDHELKARRAFKHLEDLDSEVKGWIAGDHYSVRYEYDPEARWTGDLSNPDDLGTYLLASSIFIPGIGPQTAPPNIEFGQGRFTAFATVEDPPSDTIGVLIGDFLHNLRSALDNLAFALATTYTQPLPDEITAGSEFPVFGDENGEGSARFHRLRSKGSLKGTPAPASGLDKIRGWHPDAQTVVERLQPYNRENSYLDDPLWILHVLDRIDKHRLVHTASAASAGILWHIAGDNHERGPKDVRCIGPGLIRSFGGPVGTDTPISDIWGIHPIDPSADVDMEIDPAPEIAFAPDTPIVGRKLVMVTLAELYNYVAGTVIPALAPYL
jgi:hypothetical protein